MKSHLTSAARVFCLLIVGGCSSTSAGAAPDAAASIPDGASNDSGVTAVDGEAPAPPACVLVMASSFDQSCRSDSDCMGVGQGEVCDQCTLVCKVATINVDASAQYQAAFANTPSAAAVASQPGPVCSCPVLGAPCCRGGMCQIGTICTMPASDAAANASPDADTGAADAGGDAADASAE